jgi:hypothetical protein
LYDLYENYSGNCIFCSFFYFPAFFPIANIVPLVVHYPFTRSSSWFVSISFQVCSLLLWNTPLAFIFVNKFANFSCTGLFLFVLHGSLLYCFFCLFCASLFCICFWYYRKQTRQFLHSSYRLISPIVPFCIHATLLAT